MAVNDVLAAIAQSLGLKDTEQETLNKKKSLIEQELRDCNDQLFNLKTKIRALDAELLRKKREYETSGPGIQKVVRREIEALFKKQDRFDQEIAIISDRIENSDLIVDRINNLLFFIDHPARTDLIAEIADDLDIAYDELDMQDDSLKNLDNKNYNTIRGEVESNSSRFDSFMAGSESVADAPVTEEQKQSDDDFTARLAELDRLSMQ